jgi:hypothetical protein
VTSNLRAVTLEDRPCQARRRSENMAMQQFDTMMRDNGTAWKQQ